MAVLSSMDERLFVGLNICVNLSLRRKSLPYFLRFVISVRPCFLKYPKSYSPSSVRYNHIFHVTLPLIDNEKCHRGADLKQKASRPAARPNHYAW